MNYSNREVGWLITEDLTDLDHEVTPARVGWGQLRVHATETETSYENVIGRTIFVDKSLTEHMIPEEERVRWTSFDDDGYPCYNGVLRIGWLFDEEDRAYNIDRFCSLDVGAVHVWYSVDDIIKCAKMSERPEWEDFAKSHCDQKQNKQGLWIEVYG